MIKKKSQQNQSRQLVTGQNAPYQNTPTFYQNTPIFYFIFLSGTFNNFFYSKDDIVCMLILHQTTTNLYIYIGSGNCVYKLISIYMFCLVDFNFLQLVSYPFVLFFLFDYNSTSKDMWPYQRSSFGPLNFTNIL
jgi:hypothetical protein